MPPVSTHLKVPGPGQYETLGNTGSPSHNSNFHNIKTRNFGSEARQSAWVARFNTPGPGTYRPPSDFGYVTARAFNL